MLLQCCLPADTAPPTTEQELASWLRQRLGERRVSEAPKKELSSLSNLFNFVPSQSPRSPQIWTSVVQSKLLSQTRRCQIYGSVVATTLLTLKMSSKSSAVVNIQSASTATAIWVRPQWAPLAVNVSVLSSRRKQRFLKAGRRTTKHCT